MTAPRLSICIATLNRAGFLDQTLQSIISQATDEVEIIVVDGASTDNTGELIRAYQQRFARLNYLRLDLKGGVDRDYARAVSLAQGEYCWLMSDDDLLKPGAVREVIDATRQNHAVIVVNAEVRTSDLSRRIEARRLPLSENRLYLPGEFEQLFVDTATYMSFIGCVVIQRALWGAREKEKYFGTEFIHLGVIFQRPLEASTLVLAAPWITIRGGNATWTSRYFQVWMFKWPDLIWSFPVLSDDAKRRVCPREPWRVPKILIVSRARGSYSLHEYHTWLESRLEPSERFAARLIASLPGWLVNLPVLIYLLLFRREQRYGISEIRDSPFYYRKSLRRFLNPGSALK